MQHPSSSLYMKDIESMYHASTKGLPIPFHAEVPMTHHPIHSILEDDHSNSLMNSSLYQEIQTASPLPPPLPSPTPYSSSLQKRTQVTSPTRKKEPVSQSKPPVHASKRGVSRSVYVTRHPPPSLVG
ncbi:hypothetical protein HMI54_011267 [Coelomomyces lativittatus]|nr:hypothetical protein HMI56_005823 [Coelomomyces lativittatus]KAJ1515933.1 hypothetical protein HMI55_003221 [Coelomomyces lativittatus]KAJ1515961.1 hypothetical protein HMI54_011267 [Coelomomyces lativittatus]